MRTRYILLTLLLLPVIVFAQTVSIGDILCTDGSTVKPAQFASSGKTAEGIVFYVNASDSEGWAVALDNQSSSIKWSSEYLYGIDLPNLPNFEDARAAMHDLNGYANTGIIRSQGNRNDFPAAWAVDYNNGWYLPSAGQLRHLYSYAPEINASLQVVGGTSLPYHSNNYWWSSTEFTECHAYDMNTGGSLGDYVKDNHVNYPPSGISVRQIRDFTIPNPVHPTYHVGDLITNDDGSRGILFYVSPDQSDGWMVALNDAATAVSWGSNGDVPSLTNQTYSSPYGRLLDETDGFANTASIRAYSSGTNTAANVVDYPRGWYLPTAGQLSKLFGALAFIEEKLQTYGSTLAEDYYWSSASPWPTCVLAILCVAANRTTIVSVQSETYTSKALFLDRPYPTTLLMKSATPPWKARLGISSCSIPTQPMTWPLMRQSWQETLTETALSTLLQPNTPSQTTILFGLTSTGATTSTCNTGSPYPTHCTPQTAPMLSANIHYLMAPNREPSSSIATTR